MFTLIKLKCIFKLYFYHFYFISGFLITLTSRFYARVIIFSISIPNPRPSLYLSP